jgi:hypothetical protein
MRIEDQGDIMDHIIVSSLSDKGCPSSRTFRTFCSDWVETWHFPALALTGGFRAAAATSSPRRQ